MNEIGGCLIRIIHVQYIYKEQCDICKLGCYQHEWWDTSPLIVVLIGTVHLR